MVLGSTDERAVECDKEINVEIFKTKHTRRRSCIVGSHVENSFLRCENLKCDEALCFR